MLTVAQGGEHHRDVPFPGRRGVDEIDVVALAEVFKVMVAVGINGRRLLAFGFDHLCGALALLFDDVTDRCDADIVDVEEFSQYAGAAQSDADDGEPHDVARLESHADHRVVTGLRLWRRRITGNRLSFIARPKTRQAQRRAGHTRAFQQVAAR